MNEARISRWPLLVLVSALGALPSCAGRGEPIAEASLLASHGQTEAAIARLRAHLVTHPEDTDERRMIVRLHGSLGNIAAAEREVEELAKRLPADSPIPWIEMGHVMELGHDYEAALSFYDRAAAVASSDPSGPRVGGLRAARWGMPELARPRLEEAVKRDPKSVEAWHALGLVRLHLDDPEGARRAYEAALRADPDAVENHIGLATVALKLHQPKTALLHYDRVLSRRPDYTDALLGRSWALILSGRFDEARAALRRARERGADDNVVSSQLRLLASLEARRLSRDNH